MGMAKCQVETKWSGLGGDTMHSMAVDLDTSHHILSYFYHSLSQDFNQKGKAHHLGLNAYSFLNPTKGVFPYRPQSS